MLADGISFPVVAALGLVVCAPLTLLVTTIECLIFRFVLSVTFRSVFCRLLIANMVSTLAGGIVYGCQDSILDASGITASIPEFVTGYRWVALLLMVMYFAKSVLVESLIVATRSVSARIGRTRSSIFKAMVAANVASYCLVGPIFFFATRPTFGNVELLPSTKWTANSDFTVYFIDPGDHFIKRIQTDGSDRKTIVPFPAEAFLMSEDLTAFAYRGTDGNLYFYNMAEAKPVKVCWTNDLFLMDAVSLSPDKTRIAFAQVCPTKNDEHGPVCRLRVFDTQTRETTEIPYQGRQYAWPTITWSQDGMRIYVQLDDATTVAVYPAQPPWDLIETRHINKIGTNELAVNYRRFGANSLLNKDYRRPYRIDCALYLPPHIRISRNAETVMVLKNDYGLLKLGFPGPHNPSFLPNGYEAILEWWGQLYILDCEQRRLGLLTRGGQYVAAIPRFRARFLLPP